MYTRCALTIVYFSWLCYACILIYFNISSFSAEFHATMSGQNMQEHPKSKESFLCWPRPSLWCEEHLWQLQIRTGPGAGTDEAAGGGQAFRKTEMGPGNDTSEGWLAIEMIRCLIETPWSLAWYILVLKSCSSTYTWSHLQLFFNAVLYSNCICNSWRPGRVFLRSTTSQCTISPLHQVDARNCRGQLCFSLGNRW